MNLRTKMKMLIKGEASTEDVISYIVGNYRYWLYYSGRKYLMRDHIWEQINLRINKWMDEVCYLNGECKMCGCATTALQMADKSCERPCYPPMMTKKEWKIFQDGRQITFDRGKTMWLMDKATTTPIRFIFKNKKEGYVRDTQSIVRNSQSR